MAYCKHFPLCVIFLMTVSICVGMSVSPEKQSPVIPVQILDMSGKPLSGIKGYLRRVILNKDGSINSEVGTWEKIKPSSSNGQVNLQSRSIYSSNNKNPMAGDGILGYEVFLAGKNISPTIIRFPIDSFPKNIKVDKGVEVIIKLKGETTKGKPKVVYADNTFFAINKNTTHFIDLKKNGKNTWKCTLKKGDRYVIGWLSNKLYGYQSEPFIASESLKVDFSPAMPATFEYDLTITPQDIQVLPAKVFLLVKIFKNGKTTFLSWGGDENIEDPRIMRIKGLASGLYQIKAHPRKYSFGKPFLHDIREIKIKPGVVNQFQAIYPTIDTVIEDGDVTVHGVVYDSDQNPVPNKTVKLIPIGDKGRMFDLYYPFSVTDKDGGFKFTGVRPNIAVNIKCAGNTAFLGKESLSENASILVNLNVGPKKKLPTSIGTRIQDIFIKWKDGNNGKLSDFKGKVIVIDFWASWCPPCIRALPQLNAIAKEKSWKKDVIFIALSSDHDRAIWKKTIDKYNWDALRHGWFDREKNAFVFSKPLPYSMIIDTNGMIFSAGNDIDIKRELNRIVNK